MNIKCNECGASDFSIKRQAFERNYSDIKGLEKLSGTVVIFNTVLICDNCNFEYMLFKFEIDKDTEMPNFREFRDFD